jgi:LuxR family transcriptional regulator, maltose regulon positive regulatory protein
VVERGDHPLLESKLAVPAAPYRVLARERLNGLLDCALAHRITIVSAPAGWGKTVACALWARSRRGRGQPVAWLNLDRSDNDPARFASFAAAALLREQGGEPGPPSGVRGRASHGSPGALSGVAPPPGRTPPTGQNEPEDFALWLAEIAEGFASQVTLVLDGVHEIAHGDAARTLAVLCGHAPPALRLVLVGRHVPQLRLARLRLSGELVSIDAADLACTPDELSRYFGIAGVSLDPATRDELLRHTEGWIAGVRMAAARGGALVRAGYAADAPGTDPVASNYLNNEVLARHDPQTRLFLLRTSVVEHLTAGLADQLAGTGDGGRYLDRLVRENSFVLAVDGRRNWYRYHPQFRELLLAELRRGFPHEVPVLFKRAARWYVANGMPADALRSAIAAQDWDHAADVLTTCDIDILLSRGAWELDQELGLIPSYMVINNAAIATACAATRLWSDDPESARPHLENAENALAGEAPNKRRIIELKLAALRLIGAQPWDLTPHLLASAEKRAQSLGAEVTGPARGAAGLLFFALGTTYLRRSQVSESRHALLMAERQLAGGDQRALRGRARAWRAVVDAWHGNLTAAERTAMELAGSDIAPISPAIRHVTDLALAVVNLQRHELTAVHRLLDGINYRKHLPVPGEPLLSSSAEPVRIRTLIAQGNIMAARARLTVLNEKYSRVNPAIAGLISNYEREIALRTGDIEASRAYLEQVSAHHVSVPGERVMRGRLLLAATDPDGALEIVTPILHATVNDITLHYKVASALVAAVANYRLGWRQQAAELLEQAIVLAEPEGAFLVFVAGGPAVRSALRVLLSPASRGTPFARKLMAHFETQLPVRLRAVEEPVPLLTGSELAVVRSLAVHRTNREIGDALFLSVNTVKTHLRSAYGKLGAKSRQEALERARRSGLI